MVFVESVLCRHSSQGVQSELRTAVLICCHLSSSYAGKVGRDWHKPCGLGEKVHQVHSTPVLHPNNAALNMPVYSHFCLNAHLAAGNSCMSFHVELITALLVKLLIHDTSLCVQSKRPSLMNLFTAVRLDLLTNSNLSSKNVQ